MNLKRILAVLKFYSENSPFRFFTILIMITLFSVACPFLVEDGCLSKYDEFS